ncbi:hypothetical protein NP493_140g00031 [Ridgeia piscesae]|uniref:Methyltransferase FkbM domain-containing protein n=1 Tax=Ridgeia piscesae TaxID=27915 RepID=A0AAD9UG99_RIDPI|nr:hypothetical protein NP493_140g00031 [Ridgeia piscesae]
MTVIDVSEKKQRQLIAEWKERLARREQALTDPVHPRLANSDGEVVNGEQLRALRRGDTRAAAPSDTVDRLAARHTQPTARRRDEQEQATPPVVVDVTRRRRVNDTARAIQERKIVQLLNRGAAAVGGRLRANIDAVSVDTYNVRVPIAGEFDCVRLAMRPGPAVCLYTDAEDTFISRNIRHTGLWEPHILRTTFQNVLYANADLGVIDVGANIGVYSLVSAAMGHDVIAVEPYEGHLRRLHKAISLGKFEDRFVVVRNALSDQRGTVTLDRATDNQGSIRVNTDSACNGTRCVRTVYMDDLTELAVRHFRSRRAVMKVDIEGHERHAFRMSDRLLDTIYVPYIFMEWQILRAFFVTDVHVSADRTLVIELIGHLLKRDYKAYSAVSWASLPAEGWFGWPDDIVWKHELADVVA